MQSFVFMSSSLIKLDRNGKIVIPPSIRMRWATAMITFEDLGDRVVIRPNRDDPIESAAGAFSGLGHDIDLDKIRREEREAERESEERKFGI
jgi:hypothetical protein